MITTTQRIIKSGFLNFWRNGFISLASVLTMVITLCVIAGLIFMSALLSITLNEIEKKVDINVYFIPQADEADILNLKQALEGLPEVADIVYLDREQVLDNFKEEHKEDQIELQALQEIGDNPFGAVFNIRAQETSQYEGIAQFLKSDSALSKGGIDIIDTVNYFENKVVIDRLTKIINTAKSLGFAITLLFVALSVVITFNTIRLAIFISKEEISVMRLVGASNMYVRGPFVVTGIMYGFIAGVCTLVLLYPITLWLGPKSADFFVGVNVFTYYVRNFGQIFFIVMFSGIVLGAISSYLAVRRYLKV